MAFKIVRNDITKIEADVIVNTANPEPVYMAGTDSAFTWRPALTGSSKSAERSA